MTGLSTNQVIHLFNQRQMKVNRNLPEVIAIDEFKGDAGREKF